MRTHEKPSQHSKTDKFRMLRVLWTVYTIYMNINVRKRKESSKKLFTPHHTATDGVGRCGDFQVLRTRFGRTEEAEQAIRLRQHTATATHGTRRRAGHAHSRRELAWHDAALQRRGTITARHGIATMIATTRHAHNTA